MPAASIIITNWNGQKWLADCLESLRRQSYPDFEIILVDDGSTDGSAAWVAEHYPEVRLIRLEQHLGFAGANNVGIRAAGGRYIVTLNNDTRADPDWLRELIGGLAAPDIGMVAAQMLVWDRPDTLDSAGIKVDWAGFGWNLSAGQPANTAACRRDVFGPCAGAALYRREMLEQIGLFDEDFYTYYEDIDLAWRAQRAGWRCLYVPTARVLHYHSATGGKASPRKIFLLSRNRWWTIAKNVDARDLWWSLVLIAGYDLASLLYQLYRQRNFAPLRARWQALAGLPKMLAKRFPAAKRVKLSLPPPF